MPKNGLLHDYDLNTGGAEGAKKGAQCAVCDTQPMSFRWSDYHGEGMCTRCGTAYQIQAGSEAQRTEGNYPYLSMKDEWVPVVRRYFAETRRWTYFGTGFGDRPGMREFSEWVTANNAAPPKTEAGDAAREEAVRTRIVAYIGGENSEPFPTNLTQLDAAIERALARPVAPATEGER